MNEINEKLRKQLSPVAETLAELLFEETLAKGPSMTPKKSFIQGRANTIVVAVEKECNRLDKMLERAFEIITEKHAELPGVENLEKQKIAKEFAHIAVALPAILNREAPKIEDPSSYCFKPEDSFQHLLNLSNETMKWIYTLGYDFFSQKSYEDALSLFFLLTFFNSLVCDYWVALGLTQRQLLMDDEALNSFAMVMLLNPRHILAISQAADIHLKQGRRDVVERFLGSLNKIAEEEPSLVEAHAAILDIQEKMR